MAGRDGKLPAGWPDDGRSQWEAPIASDSDPADLSAPPPTAATAAEGNVAKLRHKFASSSSHASPSTPSAKHIGSSSPAPPAPEPPSPSGPVIPVKYAVTPAQVAQGLSLFSQADADGDGRVTKKELVALAAGKPELAPLTVSSQRALLFYLADCAHSPDDKLEPAEFLLLLAATSALQAAGASASASQLQHPSPSDVAAAVAAVGAAMLTSSVDAAGDNALHRAAKDGRVSEIRSLLARGAFPGVRNSLKQTPLHAAAAAGREAAAVTLLEAGAPVNAVDVEGRTALDVALSAAETGKLSDADEIVGILRDAGGTAGGGAGQPASHSTSSPLPSAPSATGSSSSSGSDSSSMKRAALDDAAIPVTAPSPLDKPGAEFLAPASAAAAAVAAPPVPSAPPCEEEEGTVAPIATGAAATAPPPSSSPAAASSSSPPAVASSPSPSPSSSSVSASSSSSSAPSSIPSPAKGGKVNPKWKLKKNAALGEAAANKQDEKWRKKLQTARADGFAFSSYTMLRNPESFALGVLFNKEKVKLGQLKWSGSAIPRSLLATLDDKQSKVAVKLHGCILGYTVRAITEQGTRWAELGYKVRSHLKVIYQRICDAFPMHTVCIT